MDWYSAPQFACPTFVINAGCINGSSGPQQQPTVIRGLSSGCLVVAPAGATPGPSAPPAAAAPSPASRDSPISRVVLVGLNIVLPLINAELLKFPKLAQLYYSLLSYMLEVYPKAVAELAPQHFASLMASLEWGLLGSDTVAVHCSLEGLAGLAKYQYQALQTGAPGLAGQSAGAHGWCWEKHCSSSQSKSSYSWRQARAQHSALHHPLLCACCSTACARGRR